MQCTPFPVWFLYCLTAFFSACYTASKIIFMSHQLITTYYEKLDQCPSRYSNLHSIFFGSAHIYPHL